MQFVAVTEGKTTTEKDPTHQSPEVICVLFELYFQHLNSFKLVCERSVIHKYKHQSEILLNCINIIVSVLTFSVVGTSRSSQRV